MSVDIRIVGNPDEVAEAARRVKFLFDVVGHSNPRRSRKKPGNVLVYMEAEVVDRD